MSDIYLLLIAYSGDITNNQETFPLNIKALEFQINLEGTFPWYYYICTATGILLSNRWRLQPRIHGR